MLNFAGYERAEGWTKGKPEVLVAKPTREYLGMPLVDYDSLEQFLRDDIGVNNTAKNLIKLYGKEDHILDKKPKKWGYFNNLFPNIVNINAVCAEHHRYNEHGTMTLLAHEERHLADYQDSKLIERLFYKSSTISLSTVATLLTSKEITKIPDFLSFNQLFTLYGASMISLLGSSVVIASRIPKLEERAGMQMLQPSVARHSQDILFPNNPRTNDLYTSGQLSPEKVIALGINPDIEEKRRGLFAL